MRATAAAAVRDLMSRYDPSELAWRIGVHVSTVERWRRVPPARVRYGVARAVMALVSRHGGASRP